MRTKYVFVALLFMVLCVNAYAIKMSLPDVTADPGTTITVGVNVDDAKGIAGGDIEITYDSKVVGVKAARGTALATGLSVVANPNVPGKVTFAMAGASGLKSGSGALLEIDFEVIAKTGKTPLTISSASLFDENINDIKVDVVNGSITVKTAPPPKPRLISIKDVTGNLGDTITVSVLIDDVSSVSGGDLVLTYDKAILAVNQVNLTSLLAGMSSAVNKDVAGKINISIAGATGAKPGAGSIIDITFKGILAGTSNIAFESGGIFDENAKDISSTATGGKVTIKGKDVTATGKLSKLGITTFQYGTHGLTVDNKLAYALKSATVNMDQSVDKQVTIKGVMQHEGLSGGPPLVDVTSLDVIPVGPAAVREHKAGEPMLALQATFTQANTPSYAYIDVWKGSIPVQKGMFLEFQVTMFSGNPTFKGTVDLHTSDGGNLRDSGAKDQNGLGVHPGNDLSKFARDKWYHRKISLDTIAGKTIDGVIIATDASDQRSGVFRAYVDNIQITDGEAVLNYIWGDKATEAAVPITGKTTANGTTFAGVKNVTDYSVSIVGVTPVTPMGKLINTWGDIKKVE
jgi:hypothetical protein